MAGVTGTEQLPTGMVTLLFSDIEGSTRLLSELGGRYGDVLEAHRDVLRGAWRTHRGVEVSTEGDSFFVAFGDPQDAIDAAVTGQRALRASGQPIRVRMGVHTGVPELHARERDYWGADVHLAARVAAAAHGGQILATGATAGRVAAEFEDLGEWRLKDFERPTRLFQAVVDGEGADCFPAPRALDVRPSNLPIPENAMIGREAELRAVARMLSGPSDRLVTLVGLGGTGKTRLALAIGHELLEHFRDGVFFADLSGTTDPAIISRVVADAIGAAGAPIEDAVRNHFERRHVLVIVDNCEHVLDGVDVIAKWLAAAEGLRVLATSQAPLRLRAERCVPLESLGLPGDDLVDVATLGEVASVRLFVERVRAVDAGFALTDATAGPVAEICTRLEGMPMAIELAAARCTVLGPDQLAERLRDDLDALAAVARDVPPRQRSLRAALAWSLSLLGKREQSLFARWGVFAGRPTVARVLAVCDADLDAVEALVEHSLVRRDEDRRLRMPQSVQAHARALLASSGAENELRRHHATAMAAAAEDQHARFMLDTIAVIEESSADREDLLAALRWAAANAPDLHARLAGSIVVP
ncbi:MAG: adenylate/guanylate cyclase domain-containing protein, partial [Actinomycetota bacterium]|nr:adenylate/guanylate cyclase domain-containing protein [Actinomycetota bacterium]